MVEGRHLGFCLHIISRSFGTLLLQKSVFAQNWVKIGGTVWKLEQFFEIQDGCRPPSWTLSRNHFVLMKRLLLTKSVFPQNWVMIGGKVWKLEQYFEVQDCYHPPSWSLSRDHFLPNENVAASKISLHAKLGEDRWNGLEVRAIFRNSRWRTVAILHFVSESFVL